MNFNKKKSEKNESIPVIKISLLGCMFVGKTSLCSQYVCNRFEHIYDETKDFRVYRRVADISENPDLSDEVANFVMVEINDVFGINHPELAHNNERKEVIQKILENEKVPVEHLENMIYEQRITMGYMFVFDMTDSTSFYDLASIVDFILDCEKKAKKRAKSKKMLVGNKLEKGVESVSKKDIEDFCEKYKMKYIECSALENLNVNKAFENLARDIFNDPNLWKFEDLEKEKVEQAGKYANREIQEEENGRSGKLGFFNKILNVLPCGGGKEEKEGTNKENEKANEVKAAEAKEEEDDSSDDSSSDDDSLIFQDENAGKKGTLDKCTID